MRKILFALAALLFPALALAQVQPLTPSALTYTSSAVSGGSANAQTIATVSGGFQLQIGNSVTFVPGFNNTGDMTVNVDGSGAVHVHLNGATLASGAVVANQAITLVYDGTYFDIPVAATVVSGAVTITGGTIDGTIIGGTTRAAVNGTTGNFNGTLTGADSGTWSTSGISLGGTYNTASTPELQVAGTFNFTGTGNVSAASFGPAMVPGGASSNATRTWLLQPSVGTTSTPITEYSVIVPQVRTSAGYTGQITSAYAVNILAPSISGSLPPTNYGAINISGGSNGNGVTSGTINNLLLAVGGSSAAGAAGGQVNNEGLRVSLSSGSGAGTTNNYGIHITGNGGSGGGGTTTNYALYSDSTAPSYFAGAVSIAGAITANGSAGVSCPSGITAGTVTVVNGIVTHC